MNDQQHDTVDKVLGHKIKKIYHIFAVVNRPGVARAVLQTPLSLIDSVSHPFPPNIQQTFNPKPLQLGS